MTAKHKKLLEGILKSYKEGLASTAQCVQAIQNVIGESIEMGADKGKEYDVDPNGSDVLGPTTTLDVVSDNKGKITKEQVL